MLPKRTFRCFWQVNKANQFSIPQCDIIKRKIATLAGKQNESEPMEYGKACDHKKMFTAKRSRATQCLRNKEKQK
jgi:hypothetical protein